MLKNQERYKQEEQIKTLMRQIKQKRIDIAKKAQWNAQERDALLNKIQ